MQRIRPHILIMCGFSAFCGLCASFAILQSNHTGMSSTETTVYGSFSAIIAFRCDQTLVMLTLMDGLRLTRRFLCLGWCPEQPG